MKFTNEIEEKINKIINYLKERGCGKVLLFGSIAEDEYSNDSDIDIAVTGMKPADFFTAVSILPYLVQHKVDIIDLNDLPEYYRKEIENNSLILYGN